MFDIKLKLFVSTFTFQNVVVGQYVSTDEAHAVTRSCELLNAVNSTDFSLQELTRLGYRNTVREQHLEFNERGY